MTLGQMTVKKCALLSCFLGWFISGCKPTVKHLVKSEAYIIGGHDQIRHVLPTSNPEVETTYIPSADLVEQLVKASVLIVSPMANGEARFCSGAQYRTDDGPVIITNRHCFATETTHSEKPPELDPWACIKTQIFMDFDSKTALPTKRAACRPGSFRANHHLDLAVFKPDIDIPPEHALKLRAANPEASDRIKSVIVHFPDVADKRVRMNRDKLPAATSSASANIPTKIPRLAITYEDCETAGYFDRESMAADLSLPFAIKHTCDMIQGSSGSALVDMDTGEVLGVNWGGIKYGDSPDAEAFNLATRSELVLAFLKMPPNDLTDYLTALADSPPPELVGDGTPDRKIEKTSKSSQISVPGCAKMAVKPVIHSSFNQSPTNQSQGTLENDQHSINDSKDSRFDLAWFVFAIYPVLSAYNRSQCRRKRRG